MTLTNLDGRRLQATLLLVTLVGCAAPSSPPATGPAPPPTIAPSPGPADADPVSTLLEHFRIGSIIDARAGAFTRQVALLAGDLDDPELERLVPAVRAAFSPELLSRDVADFMMAEAPEGFVPTVADWIRNGATGEVTRLAADYTPPVPLNTWLDTYTTEPPSEERVRLVARWSESTDQGAFFLLLEQALDEAAHSVVRTFRPGTPGFSPIRGDELLDRLNRSRMAAVLTALHAHEPISDDLIRASTAEYESVEGRWYVETYQLAIAEAMRAAGRRAVVELTR